MSELLSLLDDVIECECDVCTSACHKKPGWFLPEEIKPAADFLGLTEKEFFDQFLAVDYYCRTEDSETKFVLSPININSTPGEMFPFYPEGQCIFLKDNKCSIHSAKPFECKIYDHREKESSVDSHLAVAKAWEPYKEKIAQLLGREPSIEGEMAENPLQFLFDALKMMLK